MNTLTKKQPIALGSARKLTKTEWIGDLPEFDNPVLLRKVV